MSKYEIVKINGRSLSVDVSQLLKSGVMSFNATQIAKTWNKKVNDFLRLETTKEYIEDILNDSQSGISRLEDLVRIQRGGKYPGTWLHKELALEFAGWCSAPFRRAMHKWIENRLLVEEERKRERLELKTGFRPLTNAISLNHEKPKHYHYSTECDLINRIVLGMSAKDFRTKYGVENVRDHLTNDQMVLISHLQIIDTGLNLIKLSYPERKEHLETCYSEALDILPQLRGMKALNREAA